MRKLLGQGSALRRNFVGNFMAILQKNFLEFSQQLNAHNVKYLIVGGYAVVYHGYPRSTVDFDVFVEMTKANAKRLSKAITSFGFDPKEYSADFFLTPSSILMIGREPWRIDIFTTIKGLEFKEAYKKRVYFEADGIKIPFVDRGDLIRSKKASNRDRDRDDIKRLNDVAGFLGKGKRAHSVGEMKAAARTGIAKAGAAGLGGKMRKKGKHLG